MPYKETVARITNQADIKQEILYKMHQTNGGVYEITGAHGSGKKTLSESIAASWQKQTSGVILYLKPSYKIPPEKYSVFQRIAFQFPEMEKHFINIFLESLKDIPYVGNSLSAIVNELLNIVNENSESDSSQVEQLVISKIRKRLNGKPVLFVCTDYERWDFESQNLLFYMIQQQVVKKDLSMAYFVFNNIHHQSRFEELISKRYIISSIEKNDMPALIAELNPQISLTTNQIAHLFTLTQGNLKLIAESISLFCDRFVEKSENYYDLILKRITRESHLATEVIKLLKQTAFIGEKVDLNLLQIFSSEELQCYEDALEQSIFMKLLGEEAYTVFFTEQFIYNIFREKTYCDKHYFLRLSNCIQILYPTRYDLQAKYLYQGKLYEAATIKYFLYLLKYYRENNREYHISYDSERILEKHPFFYIYKRLCKAYGYYKKKAYTAAEELLLVTYCALPEFRFEIDYLQSLIGTNKYFVVSEFSERIDILKKYTTDEFEKNHPEMYIRALMLLIEFYSEVVKMLEVDQCKKKINEFFLHYAATDKQIQCYEHCYKMKANAFYKIEIATKYTKDACEYFSSANIKPYNISKYYLATLNHSANEIISGDFLNAHKRLVAVEEVFKENGYLQEIHKDIFVNNLAISGYYCQCYSANECAEALKKVIFKLHEQADTFLLQNNLTVFEAFSGDLATALTLSQTLYEEIRSLADADEYYQYYIKNNYCILLWLTNQNVEAKKILAELLKLVPLLYNKKYFEMRVIYLLELFESISPHELLKQDDWNRYLIQKHPKTVGIAWNFWGNILLLSELQIWSDF